MGNAKSVSVTDVAARAGVSLGTVSNVLNRPEKVAEGTRARVLRAIGELGFVRNEAARQMRSGRSRTIGLIVLDTGNPFFTDIAAGVEHTAAESGLSLFLCNSDEKTERERHYLSLLEEQRVYGVLVTPVLGRSTLIEDIRHRGTPVVLVDSGSSRQQCSVSVDDVVGGELAVGHLLRQGHQRIAVVGGPVSIKQVADRVAGGRAAFRAAGRDPRQLSFIETDALNVAGGRIAGERIAGMPARRRPTAAFCANDLLALGLLQEMTRRRVDVPGELAIVGYDDIEFAAAAAVPLTSVRQPRMQLGQAAASLLIEEVAQAETHRHRQVVFEPELVVRESSDAGE
ncbi:LacI family DNA-binding transcriptional regulator [Rugosimonospora africana]|uniref:LacI family transcriptional regulator n=1 Tax=Rugosimonospora africana TaxID=556532 RepID=A0A8J3VVN7_9ACTN|nr:LacI family DNA-binding transcriptional regulator [Rugosimonospora africana]GIH20500.1 LacI family transcriptional regulator [Rugosimonospora africana]